MQSKKVLRNKFFAIRNNISQKERQNAAKRAIYSLKTENIFCSSENISVYMSTYDEFDCNEIVKEIWQRKKNCFLPILDSTNINNKLIFASYSAKTVLSANKFGIVEPINSPTIPAKNLDLVLMPLVAFDKFGNRLGRGGGYYDRTFQFLKQRENSNCRLIGVGFSAQEAEQIAADSWDVPLTGILTEKGLIFF